MARSSVVVMDVHFTVAGNNELIVSPGFERRAGAYSDAFGMASNRMLSDVAQDVAIYVQGNY